MLTLKYRSEFTYQAQPLGIELPVELIYGVASVQLRAKVDTGASFCIFQREYAEFLEIDVEAGHRETVNTATGGFEAFGHILDIDCLGIRNQALIYFAGMADFPRNVLGRAGWLNRHRLGIVDHDLKIYISHYNDLNV